MNKYRKERKMKKIIKKEYRKLKREKYLKIIKLKINANFRKINNKYSRSP